MTGERGDAMIYANLSGRSNVRSYEVLHGAKQKQSRGFDTGVGFGLEYELAIEVTFGDSSRYLYTETSAGSANLHKMIELARAGVGLNSFITRIVKKGYARKY